MQRQEFARQLKTLHKTAPTEDDWGKLTVADMPVNCHTHMTLCITLFPILHSSFEFY